LENLKGREHLENLGVDIRIILKLQIQEGKMWTGFIWLSIGASGWLL
jgi:hypothetical protein